MMDPNGEGSGRTRRVSLAFAVMVCSILLVLAIAVIVIASQKVTGSTLETKKNMFERADLSQCGDCFEYVIRFPMNYSVPTPETSYICMNHDMPSDMDYHIVKIEPIIDDPSLVHHISLFAFARPFDEDFFACTTFGMHGKDFFPYYIWFWGIGMPAFEYPPDAGFRVGKTGVKHVMLQIHYNNPSFFSNLTDSSGLRLTLTPTLRKHDVSTMRYGVNLKALNIPGGDPSYKVTGKCTSDFTKKIMEHEITVFSFSFHMHVLGRNGITQHYRDGKLLGTAGREDFYKFDAQRWNDIERFVIQPGDELVTSCFFDSTGRELDTKGGFRAVDEMCWNTVMYYPPLVTESWDGQGHCLK